MKKLLMTTLVIGAGFFLAPARAQQAAAPALLHSTTMAQSDGTRMPRGGMMDRDTMMADMKAADARLEALAASMKASNGHDQISAMEDLLTELVHNQVEMHRQMSMMHDQMMHDGMMSQMPKK